jgi:adenylate cyclase
LLGPAPIAVPPPVHDYEAAFAAYSRRDFASAAALVQKHPDDGPSRVLLERCRVLLAEPPPPGWNGVHVATAK